MLRKLMSNEILRTLESNCTLNTSFCNSVTDTKDTKTVYNWASEVTTENAICTVPRYAESDK